MTRSVKLDERKFDGIWDTQALWPEATVQVIKDNDEVKVQHQVDRQPVMEDPMEAAEEPVADVEGNDIERAPSVDVHHLMPSDRPIENRLELAEYYTPSQMHQESFGFSTRGEENKRKT